MQPPSPSTVTLILGVLGVAAAFAGHVLTRRGKRDEIRQQQVAQAFEERNTAFEQVSSMADRYKGDADYQRQLREQDRLNHEAELQRERELRERERAAFEGRWQRQLNRCRKVTDAAYDKLTEIIRFVPPVQQRDAGHVLDELEEHRREDHPEP